MIEILLQTIGKLVLLEAGIVVVIAHFDWPVCREQFRARICLESQHCFKQQRVSDLTHALNRCAIGRTLQTGHLKLQAEELNALCAVFDPIFPALNVVANATEKVLGDRI